MIYKRLILVGIAFSSFLNAFSQGVRPSTDVSVDDLIRVLRINVLKFNLVLDSKKPYMLEYWVETYQPNAEVEYFDRVNIGVGGNGEVLFQLPGKDREFGIFGEINSTWGESTLKGDTETDGAMEWVFRKNRNIVPGGSSIVAIRAFGLSHNGREFDETNMDETLKTILNGEYRRVDVFRIQILDSHD